MWSTGRVWKTVGAVLAAVLVACIAYQHRSGPELTIGTVNNADMTLMQRLSKEFERESGVRLNWVVLGESALRERLTVDIATGGDTFDLITIGSYETPLWAARGWMVPV